MKKITFLLAVACIFTMTAFAQDNNQQQGGRRTMDPTAMIKRMDDGMTKSITNLTDDQKTKIHELNTNYVNDMSKNRPQMTQGQMPSQEEMQAMRDKMTKSREAYQTSLKSILSETQYAEYEKYEKSQRQGRGGGFGGRGMMGGGQMGGGMMGGGQMGGGMMGGGQDGPQD